MQSVEPGLRVGIAGLGAIGKSLALKLDAGIPGMRLTAIAVRDVAAARGRVSLQSPCVFTDLAGLELIAIWSSNARHPNSCPRSRGRCCRPARR